MSLEIKIMAELKDAMKAQDKATMEALRAIKGAIILAKTEKGGSDQLTEEQEMTLLKKLVKQRKESAELYKAANRTDLSEKEEFEAKVISKFLPEQMGEAEVENIIKQVIARVGATSQKEMGKVMGAANQQLAGKADGKMVADIVKRLLASL
ncbi:MAG: glutamyl-tRNA amidotransferase [Bacteroidetes bacterium GWF2_38_335]|nr:MAG: glutamyl-tRNA amidotransferase [Bacteroidetes bacterium GWF2_38_335]OFY79681.1 MAG: glutamyl-tRNA amidotransferase [Bacteroidetes bacterium RIFOXYA12_FULL_38_20]HBS88995.1 glutamyl-tRNA amidotransferase [Bacteroidales bacterium]